jgi:hypothetical protein
MADNPLPAFIQLWLKPLPPAGTDSGTQLKDLFSAGGVSGLDAVQAAVAALQAPGE